ncbi:hypothetical protein [Cyclobacterium jeungdonense]|uniref:HYR domain-containing protein n=1 Tax=Cyclobacterium jeungdonense TaxID=708087 RepID=A0ABT8C5X4_9BACT|nr:hypothetical protein [Cyclobacterium jeungdonense]MDN3687135.1 hypothetical protein [Cyclobacterium jeungdonense]
MKNFIKTNGFALLLGILLSGGLYFFSNTSFAQPTVQWDKTFGGSSDDYLLSTTPCPDGGYLLAGYSESPVSGNKTANSNGFTDFWIVKTDGNGKKVWDKTFGANLWDVFGSTIPTSDGGYLLAGYSYSPASGDKSEDSKGEWDYWVVKIDANGNKVWDNTFGGSDYDLLSSTSPGPDGGFLLAGYSDSPASGDKSEDSKGSRDYWVVKTDGNGNKVWDKTLGGSGDDVLHVTIPTSDGGYLLAGESNSPASCDKSENRKGGIDYWVVKIDGNGNKVWDKTLGGSNDDRLFCATHSPDGGYLLAGESDSPASGDKSGNKKGFSDYWVVKIDGLGNKVWDKTIGGSSGDGPKSFIPTPDGGFLLAGDSWSDATGDKSEDNIGSADYWVVKIDGSGNKVWDKTIGGSSYDYLYSTNASPDGGYLLAGSSDSPASGNKSEDSKGGLDYWVVKLQEVVEDNEAPVIEAIAPITVTTDAGTCTASVAFSAEVTDNYDASVSPVFSILLDGASTEICSPYTFPLGETLVFVNATDAAGNCADEQTFTVTVTNNAPMIIGALKALVGSIPVGTTVTVSDVVTDNNLAAASWHWSDGSVSPATLVFDSTTETYLVRGERTFENSGTYTVELRVADLCGVTAAHSYQHIFMVDGSDRGKVIGVGSIYSPRGAYTADASLTGSARFLVSFHNHNKSKPIGSVLFRFGRANLNFWAWDLDWMSIEGAAVQLRGEGRINGRGRYGFFLSLVDAAMQKGGRDRLRIKIWERYSGRVVYDNEIGSPENAIPGRALSWGGIGVYQSKTGPGFRFGMPETEATIPHEETGELSASEIRVYPNPVGEVLYIDTESDYTETVTLSIHDMAGRTLHKESRIIHKGPNQIVMDARDWNANTGQLLLRLMSPSTGFHHFILLKP